MADAKQLSWFGMLRQTVAEWSEDRASTLAAALSYSAIFALGPIVVIAVYVAGLVLGHHRAARNQVHGQIAGFVGEKAAEFFDQVIQKTYEASIGNKAVLFSVISGIVLLYAATNLFYTLQDSLNVVWHVERDPRSGWKAMLWSRFVTFLMVVGVGLLLLGSVVASAYVTSFGKYLVGGNSTLLGIFEALVSIILFTLLFAAIMKYLPDAKVEWEDVLVGAGFTAVLFTAGKYALAMYLTRASVSSSYGAAGSIVVMMLFVYYSSQIFFLGAKFTSVYARRTGSAIQPGKNAVTADDARKIRAASKAAKGLAPRHATES